MCPDARAHSCIPTKSYIFASRKLYQNNSTILFTLIFLFMASIKNRPKLAATQSKQAKNSTSPKATLQPFMQENIDRMHRLGKVRTGETYTCTLNSFMRFRQGKDVFWEDFDADLMASYEAYLKSTGVGMNTISFYNRILRAVYNRAVEKGFTKQVFPFKHVYTGVEKTIKRGLPINTI